MIEEKPELRAAKELMWEAFGDAKRGTVIPWDTIAETIDIDRTEPGFKTVCGWFKRYLLSERKLACRLNQQGGIRICTVDEQREENPSDRTKKARRSVQRGLRELTAISDVELTEHGRRHKSAALYALKEARRRLSQCRKTIKKTETHPARPVPQRKVTETAPRRRTG